MVVAHHWTELPVLSSLTQKSGFPPTVCVFEWVSLIFSRREREREEILPYLNGFCC